MVPTGSLVFGIGWFPYDIILIVVMFCVLMRLFISYFFTAVHLRELLKREYPTHGLNTAETKAHLEALAQAHTTNKRANLKCIVLRYRFIRRQVSVIRKQLSHVPPNIIELIPASVWLFDNYYAIYKEILRLKEIIRMMKRMRLPVVEDGIGRGLPRIYVLAWEIIHCAHRHIKEERIIGMLEAYQARQVLSSKELSVFPHLLSLCLLEEIVEESDHILENVAYKAKAEKLMSRVTSEMTGKDKNWFDLIHAYAGAGDLYNDAFLSHIFFQLKNMSVNEEDVENWLESFRKKPSDFQAKWLNHIMYEELKVEAGLESTISGLIIRLKKMGNINWAQLFESVSLVERILMKEPAGVYREMDQKSKQNYRWAVEKIAKKWHMSENDVAQKVILYIKDRLYAPTLKNPMHVGTYLLGKGHSAFIRHLIGRPSVRLFLQEWLKKLKGVGYFVGISLLTLLMLLCIFFIANNRLAFTQQKMLWLILVFFVPVLGCSIGFVNQIFSRLIRPKPLMSMDYIKAIPKESRTFVVMPVILGSEGHVDRYVARMERHYLTNKQANLYFAILGDFKDAPKREMPEDAQIKQYAEKCVSELNRKYHGTHARFYLFMRPRKWNASENCWMGWERKRGKLEEFNALLCGEANVAYTNVLRNSAFYRSFKYVITLDADTQLPPDTAAKLVGIMAHPLNKPVLDPKTGRITEGYVIVQSELRNRIALATKSVFRQLFGGQVGVDPYATVVSDIYQDIFSEGVFVGKGIYDLRMMQQLLRNNFPENSILSHDLLESCYARCAFASGIQLMERSPRNIVAYMKREHRWVRGDWQLLPWIFRKSPINGLSRWKLIDNLRRSLTHTLQLMAILLNFALFPQIPWLWVTVIFFDGMMRLLVFVLNALLQKAQKIFSKMTVLQLLETGISIVAQVILGFVLLPYRVYMSLDAILRTLYRLLISHKFLLEWQTAETIDERAVNTLQSYIRMMWMSAIPAVALFAAMRWMPANVVPYAVTIATLWLLSPVIAFLANIPMKAQPQYALEENQRQKLREMAYRTWQYFADYSTEENNWICPDNVQEIPGPKVTDKASPTNIGLQLLSALSARDFGFVGLHAFITYCERVMGSVQKMTKWQGHLYNWVDIKTLALLSPDYVSAVDSGNFVAYLIALKNGLNDLIQQAAFPETLKTGLADALRLAGMGDDDVVACKTIKAWKNTLRNLRKTLKSDADPTNETDGEKWLRTMCEEFWADMNHLAPMGLFEDKQTLKEMAEEGNDKAAEWIKRVERLVQRISAIIHQTNFKALYDKRRNLFYIGYHASANALDKGHYDLIASEARLLSFVAIAKGDVPQIHWQMLGRPLTLFHSVPTFMSWGGTVFEYLMPQVVMNNFPRTSMSLSCHEAILAHIAYGKKKKIPWGISESQYFNFDMQSNYQYKSFGIPALRLSATLNEPLVVAPYATMLALMTHTKQALANMERLRRIGMEGRYGFYEAVDFGRPNAENMQNFSIIQSFMAHHQGMSLVAINNLLNHYIMQNRFHKEAIIRANDVLLEEVRTPGVVAVSKKSYTVKVVPDNLDTEAEESRHFYHTTEDYPCAHVLANAHYLLMMTSGGEGFSQCDNMMISRWHSDEQNHHSGTFVYVRNVESDEIWSNTYRPTQKKPNDYHVIFSHDKMEYIRRDDTITTHTSIAVAPTENVEVRTITFSNNGEKSVTLEVTSYMEMVADRLMSDLLSPAFSKLFTEIEYIPDKRMLLGKRRPRNPGDPTHYVMHMVISDSKIGDRTDFEIDRNVFIGRKRTLQNPRLINERLPLSNRAGISTDAIMSLRTYVTIPPGKSTKVNFVTGYDTSREKIMHLSNELSEPYALHEIFISALFSSKLEMKYLHIHSKQVNAIQDLVGGIYYPNRLFRDHTDIIKRNVLGQSGLWRFSISGDNPIMLVSVDDVRDIGVVKDMLLALQYLRKNSVRVDLVILNEQPSGYSQELNRLICELTSNLKIFYDENKKPTLFLVNTWMITPQERDLLFTTACWNFCGQKGLYYRRLKGTGADGKPLKLIDKPATQSQSVITLPKAATADDEDVLKEDAREDLPSDMEFFNGIGGFVKNGTEYEIILKNGLVTPAPWINVIANNDAFGFHISETGAGYTWAGNSQENKLTNWYNDPVVDPVSEAIYIKDLETGHVSSPACLGNDYSGTYYVRHGFGYSEFEHKADDLDLCMTVFAAQQDPVKLWKIDVRNMKATPREITVTLYAEWVLGNAGQVTAPYIVTEYDKRHGMLTARNVYQNENRQRKAFLFASEPISGYTGNRKSFVGDSRNTSYPQGLRGEKLDADVGVALDACGVIEVHISLNPFEKKDMVFGLGQTEKAVDAARYAKHYRQVPLALEELHTVKGHWMAQLGCIRIQTPDRALDILMNGWLLYQAIACRMNARAAFYQCGGAFGFRDQLQDVLALLHVSPERVKQQILLSCSRQFEEGDVQHWWHANSGVGVRTRITDDLLWLPYVTSEYIKGTGDDSILQLQIPFIKGMPLGEKEHESVFTPEISDRVASVYEHCLAAIRHTKLGKHGLPLMGGGDWNDGMNRVGIHGIGESVWLGWFLLSVIDKFIPLVAYRGDEALVKEMNAFANQLKENLEKHGWDGDWYLRAYFDNGQPLGSKENIECRIDSITQSWAVLSGKAKKSRAQAALRSAAQYLVNEELGMILLLMPPFDKTSQEPGYIKGYCAGVRENGGQYTHAAIWLAMAFAQMKDVNRAYQMICMLNPIRHALTYQSAMKYATEPYVMTADVLSAKPYAGKGGWSWYTGSASWMYQAILHTMLGFNEQNGKLHLAPAVPAQLVEYTITYQYKSSCYIIKTVSNVGEVGCYVESLEVDGKPLPVADGVDLIDDGQTHHVMVRLCSQRPI